MTRLAPGTGCEPHRVVTDGGEVRARHVYVREGAREDVLATWRATRDTPVVFGHWSTLGLLMLQTRRAPIGAFAVYNKNE